MKLLSIKLSVLFLCIDFSNGFLQPNLYLKFLKRKITNVVEQVVPKNECSVHLQAWISDIFNFNKENLWALQMLDASAKLQSGLLSGNIFNFGDFDECLKVQVDKGEIGTIQGQYCTVSITRSTNSTKDLGQLLDFANTIPDIMDIREGTELKKILGLFRMNHGICLPKSCSAESIQKLWNYVEYSLKLPLHVSIKDDFCSYKGKVPFVLSFDQYVIWGFGLYFCFIYIATLYDVYLSQNSVANKSFIEETLCSFSLAKNISKLLKSPYGNITCLRGLKTISLLWIIFGHLYTITFLIGTTNMIDHFEWRKSWSAQIVLIAPYGVDTFFAISGLLLSYKYMEFGHLMPRNKIVAYMIFFLGRALRLWPGLIAIILLKLSILKYMNDGPFWPVIMNKASLPCRFTGWITAIFATNMIKFQHQCFEESWYLAIDAQLWCLAPFILHLLRKYSKKAIAGLLALCGISMIYTYYVTVINQEKWSPSDGVDTYHELLYQSTFVRMPVWIFGIITGNLLYKYKKIKFSNVTASVMWTVVAIIFLGVAIWHNSLNTHPYDAYQAGLFNAFSRPIWGIAVCFVIILCVNEYGGIVNYILSLEIHQFIVKMAYSVFLVQTSVIILVHGGKRSASLHSSYITIQHYFVILPFILLTSLAWCLAFESPYLNIMKFIVKKYTTDYKPAIKCPDKAFKTAISAKIRGINRKLK
ncbi:nose resistant to fluoxetine protein 6-like [Euwallacea fornicatus]|uniref:nose resistant to fluoxetine protein 6-like n=1 Tax=Euwallacea fornicatus TaxID=995702 RepID=UPI00338FAF74